MSLKLWPEQQAVFNFAIKRKETALFCEQRTGKTYVTLSIIQHLIAESVVLGEEFCGILVSLLSNKESTWADKAQEFVPNLNITSDFEEFKKLPSPRLLLVHFESLDKFIAKLVRYKKLNWACVDEAQKIANRGTKQSRAMARLSWISRKLILTGTPIEKQPIDLFGQFRFLAPDVFGKNWGEFEKKYMEWPEIDFKNAPHGSALWQQKILQQRILKSKATFREEKREEFQSLIDPYCIRLTQSDVGIIKPIVHKVSVPMSKKQRRVYDEMMRDSFSFIDSQSRVMAPLTITNIAKRRQIATGFVYDDEEEVHHLSRTKLNKMVELVDKLPKPLVVFTAFRPDNDAVTKRLKKEGYDVAQVNGQTPRKKSDRSQIWRDFQECKYDVVVVQIKVGGVGVDLWKANNAIVYSMGHSFRDWDQALARLSSKDKKKPPEFFVLCSENSIDEDLFELVIVKKLTSEEVLSRLKKGVPQWPQRKQRKQKKRRLIKLNRNSR